MGVWFWAPWWGPLLSVGPGLSCVLPGEYVQPQARPSIKHNNLDPVIVEKLWGVMQLIWGTTTIRLKAIDHCRIGLIAALHSADWLFSNPDGTKHYPSVLRHDAFTPDLFLMSWRIKWSVLSLTFHAGCTEHLTKVLMKNLVFLLYSPRHIQLEMLQRQKGLSYDASEQRRRDSCQAVLCQLWHQHLMTPIFHIQKPLIPM